ncbi:replication protein [Chloroflexota bacterium]
MSESSSMVYPDGKPVGRYSSIGNDVLEKIADIDLIKTERKVLTRVIRDTIGYPQTQKFTGEEVRRVTYEEPMERLVEKTGLTEPEISSALDNLEQRQIIKRDGDKITFNHHLEEWDKVIWNLNL